MHSQRKNGKRREKYVRPRITKHENLKRVTAEWQCSCVGHTHVRGEGHSSHGNGYGYGHCKER